MQDTEEQQVIEAAENLLKIARSGKGLKHMRSSEESVSGETLISVRHAEALQRASVMLQALVREPYFLQESLSRFSASEMKESIQRSVTRQIIDSVQLSFGPMRSVLN